MNTNPSGSKAQHTNNTNQQSIILDAQIKGLVNRIKIVKNENADLKKKLQKEVNHNVQLMAEIKNLKMTINNLQNNKINLNKRTRDLADKKDEISKESPTKKRNEDVSQYRNKECIVIKNPLQHFDDNELSSILENWEDPFVTEPTLQTEEKVDSKDQKAKKYEEDDDNIIIESSQSDETSQSQEQKIQCEKRENEKNGNRSDGYKIMLAAKEKHDREYEQLFKSDSDSDNEEKYKFN